MVSFSWYRYTNQIPTCNENFSLKNAEKRTISLLVFKSPENMEHILVRIHSRACWDFFLRHHPIVKTNGSSCLQCHFGGGNVLCVVSTWMKQINPVTLSPPPLTLLCLDGWLLLLNECQVVCSLIQFSFNVYSQNSQPAGQEGMPPIPFLGKCDFNKDTFKVCVSW